MTDLKNAPAVQQPAQKTQSQRFTDMVVREFSANAGSLIALTDFQKRLCQNYFIETDKVLKKAEEKRLKATEARRDTLAITWENVNMAQLATDVVSVSRVGLDPAQSNHINMIPYKNNTTNKYDIGFILGYCGCELKATKYGLDFPDDVIIELVFSNDEFKQIKKDIHNKVEGYEFKVVNNFERGEVLGGFYYFSYFDKPEKNRIRVLSKADIEKRKPEYASVEFWGGEKDEWKNGVKTGKKIKIEGWYEEMCYKTIARAAYNSIVIDSQKIDDDYMRLSSREKEVASLNSHNEVRDNANGQTLSIEDVQEAEVVPNVPIAEAVVEVKEQPKQEVPETQKEATGAVIAASDLFEKAGKPNF